MALTEYDFNCKTYFQGYNSSFVHISGACYWISDHANYSFEDARNHCHDIDGVSLTIGNLYERSVVAWLTEQQLGRKLTVLDLFWSSYVQEFKSGKWSNKEDGTELNELIHKGFDPLSCFTLGDFMAHVPGECGIHNGREFALYREGVNCARRAWAVCKRVVPLD